MQGVGVDRQGEEGPPHHQGGVSAGQVGELAPPGGVADGEDPAVGGEKGAVSAYALPDIGDPGGLQVQPLQRRRASHGDQQVGTGDPDLLVP